MTFLRTHQATSKILVIESDPLMLTAIGSVLDMQGYRCVLARNETMALDCIAAGQFDAIVLSIDQLQTGCDFAARLRGPEINRDVPIIFLVPELSSHSSQQLSTHGGVSCLLKPIDPYALLELVEKALWMPHVARGRGAPPSVHLHQPSDWVKLSD